MGSMRGAQHLLMRACGADNDTYCKEGRGRSSRALTLAQSDVLACPCRPCPCTARAGHGGSARWHAHASHRLGPATLRQGLPGLELGRRARLAAAVHRAVHGRDGREVDDLHVAAEVAVAHDLARRVRMHADDAAVAQVEHVAAVQLRGGARSGVRRRPRALSRVTARFDVPRGLGS